MALRVQRAVARLERAIDFGVFWLAAALLAVFTACLFVQVLFRYVVKQPVPWTEEGARFALVWFSLTAATITAREGSHFVFRWATKFMPDGVRYWLRRFVDCWALVLLGLICKESLDYLPVVANQTAPGTGVNMQWAYGGVSFGAAALVVVYSCELIDALLSRITHQRFSRKEAQEESIFEMITGGQKDESWAS